MKFVILVSEFLCNMVVRMVLADVKTSTCYGDTHFGAISNAVKLPSEGSNYQAYSQLGWFLGRTYVHATVADVMLEAYANLEKSRPGTMFVYAETGLIQGGEFKPHKTHQNGLSVDFMVPVLDENSEAATLPMNLSNKYGYDIEFNAKAQIDGFEIDFEALALHLKTLDVVAKTHGAGIRRVFFAPDLQPFLFNASAGEYIKQHIKFNSQQAWVRHDEHYHVDFEVSCQALDTQ